MRAVLQRVSHARVTVDGAVTGEIQNGFLVLLGVSREDTEQEAQTLAQKTAALRIFEDDAGRLNRSLPDVSGAALVVSNFTLYANCASGRRPDFLRAAGREEANRLYELYCGLLAELGIPVSRGVFGADMKVELINDGPVTVILDTDELSPKKG